MDRRSVIAESAGRLKILLIAVALSGCVAEPPGADAPAFVPDSAKGTIIVYRPKGSIATRGESPFVSIGDRRYGSIAAGTYIEVAYPEGDVDVVVQQSVLLLVPTIPRSVTVSVVRGGMSYVRVDQKISSADFSGGVTVNQSIEIEEVPVETGQAEIAKLKKRS